LSPSPREQGGSGRDGGGGGGNVRGGAGNRDEAADRGGIGGWGIRVGGGGGGSGAGMKAPVSAGEHPSRGIALDPKLKDLVRQVLASATLPKFCAPNPFMAAFYKMHGAAIHTFVKDTSRPKLGDVILAMPDVAELVQMPGTGDGTNLYIQAAKTAAVAAAGGGAKVGRCTLTPRLAAGVEIQTFSTAFKFRFRFRFAPLL